MEKSDYYAVDKRNKNESQEKSDFYAVDKRKDKKGKEEAPAKEEEESLISKRSKTKKALLRFFLFRPTTHELKNRNILKASDASPRVPPLDKKDIDKSSFVASSKHNPADISPRFLVGDKRQKSKSLTSAEREAATRLLSGMISKSDSDRHIAEYGPGTARPVHVFNIDSKAKKGRFSISRTRLRPLSQIFSARLDRAQPVSSKGTITQRALTARAIAEATTPKPLPPPPPPVLTDDEIRTMMEERIKSVKFAQFGLLPEKMQELYPNQPRGLPMILTCSLAHLENYLTKEGIFRIPATLTTVMDIKSDFEDGWTDLSECKNPYVFAGLVCMFIREVPVPLFTYELYDEFMAAQDIANVEEKTSTLKLLMQRLPGPNYRIVRCLMIFWNRVKELAASNKMTSKNIGLIFGNTLLKAKIEPPDLPIKVLKQCALIDFMIIHTGAIFNVTEEEWKPYTLDGIEVKEKPKDLPIEEEYIEEVQTSSI